MEHFFSFVVGHNKWNFFFLFFVFCWSPNRRKTKKNFFSVQMMELFSWALVIFFSWHPPAQAIHSKLKHWIRWKFRYMRFVISFIQCGFSNCTLSFILESIWNWKFLQTYEDGYGYTMWKQTMEFFMDSNNNRNKSPHEFFFLYFFHLFLLFSFLLLYSLCSFSYL